MKRVFVILLATALTLVIGWQFYILRTTTRWFALSQRYKAEVLAQPTAAAGELKHIEWDGWGWAGQDTIVYLVSDPTDSLSLAVKDDHQLSKFHGLPCQVAFIHQLERHWYTVQFYTNEAWGRHNALDCTTVNN